MSSCATVPTETQFQVATITSSSLSTTVSVSTTTLPPSTVITGTSTVCLDPTSAATCSSTSLITLSSVIQGSTSAVTVPVTVPVVVTHTTSSPTKTLFSTSCAPTSAAPAAPTTPNTPPPSSSTPTPTPSSSDFTPAPLLVTSSSALTLSNGTVVTTNIVVTTTTTPAPVFVTPPPTPSLNQGGDGSKSSTKIAPIIGGVVGGSIALLALLAAIWYIWRRSKRWNDIFDREEDEKDVRRPRMSLDGEDVQPRPYHYGLVGHSSSPSPPGSPPLGAVNSGHSPSNSITLLNAPPQHSRSSSGIALSSPASMSRSMSDLGSAPSPSPQSGHSRPNLSTASSTAASTRPLLERSVNHTRPPSSWSIGGQSIAPNADILTPSRSNTAPLSPRPHSAGGTLQTTPGPAATSEPMPQPRSSPANEKRRLLASLPQGAAAPTPPSSAIAGSAAPTQFSRTNDAPRISPRNPRRPSSAKSASAVVVHTDAGPAAGSNQPPRPGSNEPPAYTPT